MQEISKNIDLKACLAGNRKEQFRLYEKYKVRCFGICLRYARNHQEAEDILQEGFLKVFKVLHQYSGKGSFEGWLRSIMVRTALMHIRKYRAKEMLTVELDEIKINKIPDPDMIKRQKNGDHIIYLIQQLPVLYQSIFNLRAIEEYSFKEIGELLNMNETTVRSYYFRARKALQKSYSELRIEQQ